MSRSVRVADAQFRHEALLYRGMHDFLDGAVRFLGEGIARSESMLCVLTASKIDALRERLGLDAATVTFADMVDVGTNPARIIPAWRDFVNDAAELDMACRGIGEPIWAERSEAELIEAQRHESLLNLAFSDTRGFSLLCPYDLEVLPEEVIKEAESSHPTLIEGTERRPSPARLDLDAVASPFDAPLPEPVPPIAELPFTELGLNALRQFVATHAAAAGLGHMRCDDLVLAVNEVATNSLRYGGGTGVLRIWCEQNCLVCEVRDRGRIADPLVGRHRPHNQDHGQGLWLVNQICELVQIRTYPLGNVIRMHMRLPH